MSRRDPHRGAARTPAREPPPDRELSPPGPKGFRRSDDSIRAEICERLARPSGRFDASDLPVELDASDVTVSVAGGQVTLEGTVPELRMKHCIEDLVDACPGVQDIENRIRVRS